MKIAYILPSLSDAAPIVVIQLLSTLMTKNGHQCMIFYFDEKEVLKFDCPTQKIKAKKNINFQNFDIVHSTGMRPDIYVAKHREYSGKVKYITTIHNFFMEDFTSQYNGLIAQLFGRRWMYYVNRFDEVVVLSKVGIEYYKKWIKKTKLTYAYNARVIDKNLKVDFPIKDNSKIIGINAFLSPIKGIEQMIKALVFLPEYKLFIVGDGKSKKNLESLANTLGVKERCYFAGFVKDAFRFLKYYDLYAIPSRSEGFSLSLLESCLYKKPTVCSRIPIFEELFNDDEVSFFDLDNISSLVEAIKRSPNVEKMYNRYQNCYTPEKMYERYLDIYNGKV